MADPDDLRQFCLGCPVLLELQVYWGEMDSYRHVNNVVYFRYFENARLEYVLRLDWPAYEEATGIGPILQATQCRFRRPLTWPDTITVTAHVTDIAADRFTLEHKIVSHRLGEVAAVGTGTVVTFDYRNNAKVPIPDELKRRIAELEASAPRA
ncbi:MAG: acyl-CoA thioesterase [Gemmataceae bacterium]